MYGGATWNEGFGYVGGGGNYWSSVVYNDDYAYYLYFDVDAYLYPQYYFNRDYGSSVRCVLR